MLETKLKYVMRQNKLPHIFDWSVKRGILLTPILWNLRHDSPVLKRCRDQAPFWFLLNFFTEPGNLV